MARKCKLSFSMFGINQLLTVLGKKTRLFGLFY